MSSAALAPNPRDPAIIAAGQPLVATGWVPTPFGVVTLICSPDGLVRVRLAERGDRSASLGPQGCTGAGRASADAERHLAAATAALEHYLSTGDGLEQMPLDWSLTRGFRRSVLERLHRVPSGSTITYGALAAEVGHPGAARAVGTAMATNPLALFVPCHRVVRSGGLLGSYGGGTEMKRWLLDLEGATSPTPQGR